MNLIACVDQNFGIGKNGELLTHLPEDLKFFKKMTLGKVIIMGRKTLDSLPNGKALPDRTNYILTKCKDLKVEGAKVFNSVDEVLEELRKREISDEDVFISGGSTIYHEFLGLVKNAYITKIFYDFNADTYMPNLEMNNKFKLVKESETKTHNNYDYKFLEYKRV